MTLPRDHISMIVANHLDEIQHLHPSQSSLISNHYEWGSSGDQVVLIY